MPQLEPQVSAPQENAAEVPPQTGPCVMVIFGATGDLAARKLLPALYNMAKSNMLSREFAIVGVARNEMTTEQFRQQMAQQLKNFATTAVDQDLSDWLVRRLYYTAGQFDDPATYAKLTQCLAQADQNHNTHGNYFFYLATSPVFFGPIVDQLG